MPGLLTPAVGFAIVPSLFSLPSCVFNVVMLYFSAPFVKGLGEGLREGNCGRRKMGLGATKGAKERQAAPKGVVGAKLRAFSGICYAPIHR